MVRRIAFPLRDSTALVSPRFATYMVFPADLWCPTSLLSDVDRAASGSDVSSTDELEHGLHLCVGVLHEFLRLVHEVFVELAEKLLRLRLQ